MADTHHERFRVAKSVERRTLPGPLKKGGAMHDANTYMPGRTSARC